MTTPRIKRLSIVFTVLIFMSAASSGFLLGRTIKMKQQPLVGEQQLTEQVVGAGVVFRRATQVVKRLLVK